jgi:hypothetical protein
MKRSPASSGTMTFRGWEKEKLGSGVGPSEEVREDFLLGRRVVLVGFFRALLVSGMILGVSGRGIPGSERLLRHLVPPAIYCGSRT